MYLEKFQLWQFSLETYLHAAYTSDDYFTISKQYKMIKINLFQGSNV